MSSIRQLLGLAIGASLFLTGPAFAQVSRDKDSKEFLDRVKGVQDVAAQKAEADIRLAIRQAHRLGQTDPDKAIKQLKKILDDLEDDSALPKARKETLIRVVKDRIRVSDWVVKNVDLAAEAKAEAALRKEEDEKKSADKAKVKQGLETIKELQKTGQNEEATRQADDLIKQFPQNAEAQAVRRISSVADQVAANTQLKAERERRLAAISRDIQRSALPPKDDIEFPDKKKWAEITKARVTSKLTAKEKAILQALSAPVTVDFKDSRFEDVIDYLSTFTGQPMIIDKEALEQAGINYDTPITLRAKNFTVRTILRRIMGDFQLTYVIKDEAIMITSAIKAKSMLVTRTYYLGDLITGDGLIGLQNVAAIIDLIQTTVEPDTWKNSGGNGAIYFHAPTRSLVIKNSAEIHGMLIGSGMLK